MKTIIHLISQYAVLGLPFIIFMACNATKETTQNEPMPPVAEKVPYEMTSHGQTRVDNYYWMKLSDVQKNAIQKDEQTQKVLDFLTAENAYLAAKMAHTDDLRADLFEEMKGRIPQKDESVPFRENGYWYYTRYEEGQEYPLHCRKKKSLDAPEEVMLNVNDMAKGYAYFSVVGLNVSEDNNLLAFGVDTVSRRQYTIYIKDLTTNEIIDMPVPLATGGSTWANDNKTLFYTKKDPVTLRSYQIIKHKLGTEPANDPVVFQEDDETFSAFVYKTKSDRFLIIGSNASVTSHYKILDANTPDGNFEDFTAMERGHEYSIDHYKDKFYIITNWDAVNFRLMETSIQKTEKAHWKEKIPHREDVLLQGLEIFKNYMVVNERTNAITKLRIINQPDNSEHYVEFDEAAFTIYPSANMDFDTNILRFGYTSLATPTSTYDYNMETREKTLLKQQEVVGGHDPSDYITERVFATAKDGTEIPMSIIYKKGIDKNGKNPTLIYGYGSYGISMDPAFSSPRLSLLERGFIFAIAHIRGGQEMGRQWYEEGKLSKKKNSFTDFISCSEYLIENKYTSPENLFAQGGSAGGLLMGAVINMRPELYKGVIANVPFVDVITTMEDETIPLTTGEFDEWGNPADKASFDYMMTYSPYDQVKAQDYPNMLVTTGLHDSQVQYWEPAKWVAKLREKKTDNNHLFMYTNMETGHGGASGRFEYLKDVALNYAFVLDLAAKTE